MNKQNKTSTEKGGSLTHVEGHNKGLNFLPYLLLDKTCFLYYKYKIYSTDTHFPKHALYDGINSE